MLCVTLKLYVIYIMYLTLKAPEINIVELSNSVDQDETNDVYESHYQDLQCLSTFEFYTLKL